jgi:hypothetical protein
MPPNTNAIGGRIAVTSTNNGHRWDHLRMPWFDALSEPLRSRHRLRPDVPVRDQRLELRIRDLQERYVDHRNQFFRAAAPVQRDDEAVTKNGGGSYVVTETSLPYLMNRGNSPVLALTSRTKH